MRERRWIVLSGDGRHVTIGRHTDPTEEQLNLAADKLPNGLGGWLAVTEGHYYWRGKPGDGALGNADAAEVPAREEA